MASSIRSAPAPPPQGTGSASERHGSARLTRAQGWILVAGLLFGCAGTANIVLGIAAVAGSRVAGTGSDYILTHDLHASGWTVIALGLLQGIAAGLIWIGAQSGRWFGIVVAGLAIAGAFRMFGAHPVWSVVLIVVDAVIMYGLIAYGDRASLVE